MGRPVVLSNNQMLVGLNEHGLVDDFYYPYVGLDNLTTSRLCSHRIGVTVNGVFSWVDGTWDVTVGYVESTLVSSVSMVNLELGITLELNDAVPIGIYAFVRSLKVINNNYNACEVKVFFHQVFQISNGGRGDTAFFEPSSNYIYDYKGKTCLLIYARNEDGPFNEFAIGNFGIEGKDGTFRDAEDGKLSGNTIEHGGVDSVIALKFNIEPMESKAAEYWVVAGDDQDSVERLHNRILNEGVASFISATEEYWKVWLSRADEILEKYPTSALTNIKKSLLIIKAHCDRHGSILASSDSSIYNYGRDYYCYSWPRDGAYAVWPLIRLGYYSEAKAFFQFCQDTVNKSGYLKHKYQPDRAFGSTWHPLVQDHHRELAIQEDETAIVLFMICEYVEYSSDYGYFKSIFDTFIKPCADFLASFVDPETNLVHASYDLWEERFLSTTYTNFIVAKTLQRVTESALRAGIEFDDQHYVDASNLIYQNINKLYDEESGYYIKGLLVQKNGELLYNNTLDASSMYAAMMFGSSSLDQSHLSNTVQNLRKILASSSSLGLVSRYQNDYYLRVSEDNPGNSWFITSLWLAQYLIHTGKIEEAQEYVEIIERCALPSGIMSEQIHPATGKQLGVAPLVWSHAEYINTLLDLHADDKGYL